MSQLPCKKQNCKNQNKERQHECHLSEKSVAYVMYRHSEASGRIHHDRKEQEESNGDQSYAPYHVIVALLTVASAFHFVENFLFCRTS